MIEFKYVYEIELFLKACEKLGIKYEEFPFEFSDIKNIMALAEASKDLISQLLKKLL